MGQALHNLKRPKSARRSKKRVGRGNASGKGTYATRGLKGQRSRSGGRQGLARRSAFSQLLIRTPKLRGFKRQSPVIAVVNLATLDEHFNDGEQVDAKKLIAKRLIRKTAGGYKVLGNGILNKKLNVHAHYYSESAKKAIQKAGGSCEPVGVKSKKS
jgi:large subunit ribosomal protein L15